MRVTASPPRYSGGCRAPPSGRAEPSRAVPGRAAMAMDGECGRKVPEGRCPSPGLPSRRLVVVGGRGAGGGSAVPACSQAGLEGGLWPQQWF